MTSKVQTVFGDVSPSALGRTLTHEHLGMNFEHFYRQPPPALAQKFTPELELQTIGYVRQYPYSSRYNLKLDDYHAQQAVIYDVIEYKTAGGGTIVENTTEGINRHITFYQNVSQASNVHIVAGTGHYIADLQSSDTLKQSTEDVYNHMLQELTKGCIKHPDVKAGFMGEIASVWPLRDFERRAIQAAGELQPQVGCGVSFHPHRTKEAPFEIIRLYLEAGGSANKVVMSHLDRTLVEDDILLDFAELGTYCQFDLFGTEVSYYQLEVTTDMLSDAQRIQKISLLVDEGREDKILMSHDIHTKHRLTSFGGHGYAHIINNVLPKMKSKGFTQQQIDNITIGNPARWLAIENRDIVQRGRDLEGVLKQYMTHVKPAYQSYIAPCMAHADIIVPRGGENKVAIHLIVQHVHKQLQLRGFKVREKLAIAHIGQPVPDSLFVLKETPQVQGLHTFIRNKDTPRDEFIFYSKRLMRLVIEFALSLLPYSDHIVDTPQGFCYKGRKCDVEKICGVSILRAGETMEQAVCDICKDIRIGKILIQTNQQTDEPELYYLRLPKDIKDYRVILMDATVATGAAAIMAIRVLLDHDVPAQHISLVSLLMAEIGVHSIAYAFPQVKIVTSALDPEINEKFYVLPGIGNFGDRYFGTEPTDDE